ncbi:hypothetical protein CHS0354_033022 [Potamilus streckersoni]|uniref:General transcription factor 3C polypeptide 1 n=1 Tax=Potamilus streckersoni TaxID=2493646 RepID=A0AAE0RX92_9BIVA|nr:hypothetical protein CHS0354_033022 [Potamilus streckersoni]
MKTDTRTTLLREVALEGLDGITINCLWIRLKELGEQFPITIDERSKSYLWNFILHCEDLQFFELPEPRPELIPYNRFHFVDPESGVFVEDENIPEEIYPIHVIGGNGIQGSCAMYDSRKDVTAEVRGLTLLDVVQKWGEKLVVVASQEMRHLALVGPNFEPTFSFTDLTYAILERIGRSRYMGELSVGKKSIQVFNEKQKTIFYHVLKLVRLGLVRKQTIQLFRVEKKAKIYCKLFHLVPFFKEVCNKQRELCIRLCDYLEKQPEKRDELVKCRMHLNIGDAAYKKLVQSFHKYVTNIVLPFREFYPDAAPEEFLTKSGMERTIRLSVLIKHPRETDSDEEDEDIEVEEDEEGEEDSDKGSTVSSQPVFYERSGITQALMAIKQVGPKGLSQSDLKHMLGLDMLESRFLCRHLHRLKYITAITLDVGKQKKKLYVAREMLKDSKIHQEYSAEFSKLNKLISASTQHSPTVYDDNSLLMEDGKEGAEKETWLQEDLAANEEEDETEIVKMNDLEEEKEPIDVTIIETPNEEVQGLKSFTMLSDKHLRRANWVLEIVQSVKLIDHVSLTKTIREKEKAMNLPHLMDNKSLQRILLALVSEKKIRSIKTVLQLGSRQKNFHFLCSLDVQPSDEIVKKAIDQAKLRSFHVKKEQLKIAAVEREKDAKKMYLESVSEHARVVIMKLQEYRQLLKGKPPDMKYNRKKAGEYGVLPKMAKIHCIHRLLLYVCYETYGQLFREGGENDEVEMEVDVETDGTDRSMEDTEGNDQKKTECSSHAELSEMKQKIVEAEEALSLFEWWKDIKEPPIYKDEMSWKRYLPPVPCHKGYPAGWCFISDLLLYLPLSVFCQIVSVCYDIEGLLEMLAHPLVKYYPIMNLPFKLTQQLLHAKKYIYSFFEICVYMCEMGLLSFGPQLSKEKDKVFIYLHKKATLLDTRKSLPGYTKTKVPEGEEFEAKTFDLLTEQGLISYWEDLQIIALGSSLSMVSKSSEEQEDTESHEVVPLEQTLLHKTPDTVEDKGILPGDRRGAAGLDSAIFCHRRNNWTTKTYIWNYKTYQQKWDIPISYTHRLGDENKSRRLPRLAPSDSLTLKMASETKSDVQKILTKNVKGNKGGKGIKRKADSFDTGVAVKKLKRKVKKTPVEGYRKLQDIKRKKPFEKGDEKDRLLYSGRHQHRVAWTAQEDSLLLVCRIASYLMDRKRRQMVVPYTVIRDILHTNFPGIAKNKTSQACNRRLVFVQKNSQTQQNISLFLETALRDQSIVERFVNKQYNIADPTLPDIFRELVSVLVEKFRSMDIGIIELPPSLSELHKNYELEMINTSLKSTKVYKDVTCKEDICKAVLQNILHGTVLVKDKQGRSHEIFKLLTQYPEGMLRDVVKDMRSYGFLVFNKASTRTNLPSGLGLKSLKASQRYFYHFLHRMPNVVFEESIELLTLLGNRYGESQLDQQFRLPDRLNGGQIALLASLILENEINITCIVPEMLVKVDLESVRKFPFGRGKAFQTAKLIHSEGDREEKEEEDEDERDILLKDIELANPEKNASEEKNQMDQRNTGSDRNVAVATTSVEATSKLSAEISEDHGDGESSNQKGIGDNQGRAPIMQTVCNNSSTMVFEGTAGKSRDMEREFKSAFASRTLICMTRCDDISMEDVFVFNAQDNFVVNSCSAEIVLRGKEHGQAPEILKQMKDRKDVVQHVLKDCQKTLPFKLDLEDVWQKIRNNDIPEADIVKIQKIYQLLVSAKELGMTFYGIKAAYGDSSQLDQWLEVLIDHNAILKVGVTKMRYVAFPYCRPWVIHIYKNVRGRSAISKEKEQPPQKDDLDILDDKDEAEPCINNKENKTDPQPNGLKVSTSDSNSVSNIQKSDKLSHSNKDKCKALETDVNSGLSKQTDDLTSSEHPEGMDVWDSKQTNLSSFGKEKITIEGMDVTEMPSEHLESPIETSELLSTKELMDITTTTRDIKDKGASCLEKVMDTKQDMDITKGSFSLETHEPIFSKDIEGIDVAIKSRNYDQKHAILSYKGKDVTQVMNIYEGSSKDQESLDKPSQEQNKEDSELRKRAKRKANMVPPPAPVSTYETVRHTMMPWKKPEGVLNRPIMRMMLESLMLYIMAKPGISESKLFSRFSPHFQPATICSLIEMLEKVGCIEKKFIRSRKTSLFSAVTLPEEVNDHQEGDAVLYFPTVYCVQALGQLACKVCDKSSFAWPTPDKYSDSKPTHISATWTTLPS